MQTRNALPCASVVGFPLSYSRHSHQIAAFESRGDLHAPDTTPAATLLARLFLFFIAVVAHVGLYEKEATGKGIPVETFTQQMSDVDRAVLDDEGEGFVRVHVRKGTDKILGATIVAAHAGDMISEITLAMNAKAGLKTVGATIHPYPTQTDAVRKVADSYNRSRLTPLLKRAFGAWLNWSR